ncbi:hypothetical protein FACS1894216_10700 [Synergistales bacterium]|nr:hypothetical protein FACS1894216_10700 [Synergistales bacterium]
MDSTARKLDERYTYGDYRTWDDDTRWELIDGEAFCMSPAPNSCHQLLLIALGGELRNHFKGKACKVFAAPLDVLLPSGDEGEDDIVNVVQPDIMIVCDRSKIHFRGIIGAPDVIFEILSPSTSKRDMSVKFELYERSGVREYFVVDPYGESVTAFGESSGSRFSKKTVYRASDVLKFDTFAELEIPLAPIFEELSPFSGE